MTTSPIVRSYTTRETAAELRKALRAAFPGVKFSVRMATGTACGWITVAYVDGPVWDDVERIAGHYESERFNPMTDCYDLKERPITPGLDDVLYEDRYACTGVTVSRDYSESAKNWAAQTVIEGTIWFAYGEQYGNGDADAAAYYGSRRLLAATDLTHGTPEVPPRP